MRRAHILLAAILTLVFGWLAPPFPVEAAARLQVSHIDASHFPLVSFQLHVTDPSGVPPASLVTSQFSLDDGGTHVPSFQSRLLREGQRGTNILLLVDTGPSTHGAQINATQAASQSFIAGLGSSDRVAVTFFDRVIHPLTPFTADKAQLNAALSKLVVAKGQSRVYDSVYSSLGRLNDPHQRYAIILVTDGADVHSHHTQAQCVALARQKGIALYTVALGTTPVLGVLSGLSSGTHGQLFRAGNSAQLQSIYRRLVLVFRHDYLLTYRSTTVRHRGDTVRLQVRYAPPGVEPLTVDGQYTVPWAPWLHLTGAPTGLGTIQNPRHIAVPVVLSSEDTRPQSVRVADTGWPGMRISPATVTVAPYASGPLHQTFVLSTQSGFPGGRQGSLVLHFGPVSPGVFMTGRTVALPYRVLPSVLRVADVPADLHSVTDLGSGHSLHFTVFSTVFNPTRLSVQVTGSNGGSVSPTVIPIPSARLQSSSAQTVSITLPQAKGGNHGSMTVHFRALTQGVKVQNNDATIVYYVPTWWESNRKWVIPTVIIVALALYALIALTWERLTASWDSRRRAALGR